MAYVIEPIGKLINSFSKLPGVGNKTAQRYAYSVIDMSEEEAREFSESILDVKSKVKLNKPKKQNLEANKNTRSAILELGAGL